jgi:hypothetical protein
VHGRYGEETTPPFGFYPDLAAFILNAIVRLFEQSSVPARPGIEAIGELQPRLTEGKSP